MISSLKQLLFSHHPSSVQTREIHEFPHSSKLSEELENETKHDVKKTVKQTWSRLWAFVFSRVIFVCCVLWITGDKSTLIPEVET